MTADNYDLSTCCPRSCATSVLLFVVAQLMSGDWNIVHGTAVFLLMFAAAHCNAIVLSQLASCHRSIYNHVNFSLDDNDRKWLSVCLPINRCSLLQFWF